QEAYDEMLSELSRLDGGEGSGHFGEGLYFNGRWVGESDGGFAMDIPQDLLERLFTFQDGVDPGVARGTLPGLSDRLRASLRPDQGEQEVPNATFENRTRSALFALQQAADQGAEFYFDSYWADLEWDNFIPNSLFEQLRALGIDDGLPIPDAETALQSFLG